MLCCSFVFERVGEVTCASAASDAHHAATGWSWCHHHEQPAGKLAGHEFSHLLQAPWSDSLGRGTIVEDVALEIFGASSVPLRSWLRQEFPKLVQDPKAELEGLDFDEKLSADF